MLFRRRHELLLCRRLFSTSQRVPFTDTYTLRATPEIVHRRPPNNVGTKPEHVRHNASSHVARVVDRVRLSQTWLPSGGITTAEEKKDEAHSFLIQAGYIRQAHSGVYHNLPFGLAVESNIIHLITHYMKLTGSVKVDLSSISSEALWKQSGRITDSLEKDDHELMAIKDRRNMGFVLSPTHEEEITALVSNTTKSYKEFPLRLYQISRKYRDELRPRRGLLRTKEFKMKDLYTFDLTEEAALLTYQEIRDAYRGFFTELGVPFMEVAADSGNMGGNLSHEFHFPSSAGEDTLLSCKQCGIAVNEEVIEKARRQPAACPECGSKRVTSQRAIEVGHTFHLGTRYSQPLDLMVGLPAPKQLEGIQPAANQQPMVPIQMGCHGIGVSRLVGAIATMTADKKGLCWPPLIAPYHVVILCNGRTSVPEQPGDPEEAVAYDALIIDDRDKPLTWKLNDADLVGYPIIVVIGNHFKETGEYEIQCRARADLSRKSKDLRSVVCEILNALSPPPDNPGRSRWRIGGPTERERSLLGRPEKRMPTQRDKSVITGASPTTTSPMTRKVTSSRSTNAFSATAKRATGVEHEGDNEISMRSPLQSTPRIRIHHTGGMKPTNTPAPLSAATPKPTQSPNPVQQAKAGSNTSDALLREKVQLMERLLAIRLEESRSGE
ncbi:class II aaRS and biotin synthetase [Tothia fuscella]|uniref:proline--tRNA ligase n=1 Tax=Tothia fuscella TaxID=1048955 RepID=A0A9P4NSM2_9PEZI|nr:class II aaRS and biotin synthetase [Tothia fuscella]